MSASVQSPARDVGYHRIFIEPEMSSSPAPRRWARGLVPRMDFEGWLSHLLVAMSSHTSHCARYLNVATSSRDNLDGLKHVLPALPCLDRLDLEYKTSPLRSQRDTAPLFSLGSRDSIPSLRTLCLTNFTVDSNRVTGWDQCHHIRHLGLDGGLNCSNFLRSSMERSRM